VTHFFAPAWRNPAVEVIAWEKTDPAVVEYLRWAFCMTGKVPLVTADVACFMLDRIFDNWCNESAMLLDRATAAEIDSVAAEFVHAGPFFVLNLAHGNPIITETNTLQAEMEGAHYDPAPIFKSVDTWVTVPPGRKVEVAATPRRRSASACSASCSRKAWTSSTARSAIRPTSTSAAGWRWASSTARST
jgi:enoyl-CoA hydratase/3-hydroxyacyl-CoA dehydrogenase